jgi:Flp pilus assembly protein TadB
MTCPRCSAELESGTQACTECGAQLVHNVSGVMKTSAVMIASGEEHGFYHSVQDVPEPLRTQLIEITNSANAGTIVIADRAGKEQLTQVIARREAVRERRNPGAEASTRNGSTLLAFSFLGLPGIAWAGLVLLLAACVIIAAVFITHW